MRLRLRLDDVGRRTCQCDDDPEEEERNEGMIRHRLHRRESNRELILMNQQQNKEHLSFKIMYKYKFVISAKENLFLRQNAICGRWEKLTVLGE